MAKAKPRFDAWNPGLTSEIPVELLPRVTLFDPENSDTGYQEAAEAARFCGLKPQEMAAFKVSRLAMHEVLIRVTADLYVPDGPNYEELGINLRGMAERVMTKHVRPRMQDLEDAFSGLRAKAGKLFEARLEADIFARNAVSSDAKPSLVGRLFGTQKSAPAETEPPELLALSEWQDEISRTDDPFALNCLRSLHSIVGGIVGQRGRLMADRALVVRLATTLLCNSYGSRRIGELIDPIIREAAGAEGYRLLPHQAEPFVMNVKGASAAGKSTIRPVQRELAGRLGVNWEDFALVSPDYWRKFLLDYQSLGEHFKYAAMLTGQELEIIDKKLDGYMEAKAALGQMPHLLIDRFRFDSFTSSKSQQADSRLLSRFGHTVFMFFMITPPTETVERAWQRGKSTGRYKAVDDLLFHNIEAYTGMAQLFLHWVHKKRQKVHFEFLDNDVPFGEQPRTVAYGWNGQITVLDPACIRSMTRYKNVNVDATRPEDVLQDAPDPDEDILATFINTIPSVAFVDPKTLQVLAQIRDADCVFHAPGFLKEIALEYVCSVAEKGHKKAGGGGADAQGQVDFAREKTFTIGAWRRA